MAEKQFTPIQIVAELSKSLKTKIDAFEIEVKELRKREIRRAQKLQKSTDLCPLCGNADLPGTCTCLRKNAVMGYGTGAGSVPKTPGMQAATPGMPKPGSPTMGKADDGLEMCKGCGKPHPMGKCMGVGKAEKKPDWRKAGTPKPCHKCGKKVAATNIHGQPQCSAGSGCQTADAGIRTNRNSDDDSDDAPADVKKDEKSPGAKLPPADGGKVVEASPGSGGKVTKGKKLGKSEGLRKDASGNPFPAKTQAGAKTLSGVGGVPGGKGAIAAPPRGDAGAIGEAKAMQAAKLRGDGGAIGEAKAMQAAKPQPFAGRGIHPSVLNVINQAKGMVAGRDQARGHIQALRGKLNAIQAARSAQAQPSVFDGAKTRALPNPQESMAAIVHGGAKTAPVGQPAVASSGSPTGSSAITPWRSNAPFYRKPAADDPDMQAQILAADKKAAGVGIFANLFSRFKGVGQKTWDSLGGSSSARPLGGLYRSEDMAKATVGEANKEIGNFQSLAGRQHHPVEQIPFIPEKHDTAGPGGMSSVHHGNLQLEGFQSLKPSLGQDLDRVKLKNDMGNCVFCNTPEHPGAC